MDDATLAIATLGTRAAAIHIGFVTVALAVEAGGWRIDGIVESKKTRREEKRQEDQEGARVPPRASALNGSPVVG